MEFDPQEPPGTRLMAALNRDLFTDLGSSCPVENLKNLVHSAGDMGWKETVEFQLLILYGISQKRLMA
jgi:hypothetical protein